MYDKLGELLNEAIENDLISHSKENKSELKDSVRQAFETLDCSSDMNFEQIKAKYYMMINSKKNEQFSSSNTISSFRKEIINEYEKAFLILEKFYSKE